MKTMNHEEGGAAMWIRMFSALCLILVLVTPAWAANSELFVQSTLHDAEAGATADGKVLPVDTFVSVGVQLVISATATVELEVTGDGTNWVSKLCTLTADGSTASSVTASGLYQCNVAGLQQFRARISANSGTVTVVARASTAVFSGAGSTGVAGWPTTSTTKEITWANSLANAVRIGDGVTPMCLYTDATLGPVIIPCTASNTTTIALTNFTWSIWDQEGAAAMLVVDPDAASTLAMWQVGTAYRWKKSIWFGAGALSTDGTQCAAPAEATPLASGVKLYTIICTDNDAGRMHGSVVMPSNWDGGTLTFESTAVQTAASAGVIEYQVAAQCKGDTEALVATASYGTEVVWTDTLTGSSGVNRATSGAVTPSGTCAAGDFLAFYVDIGATNTTTAVATLHTLGFKMTYSETGPSQ